MLWIPFFPKIIIESLYKPPKLPMKMHKGLNSSQYGNSQFTKYYFPYFKSPVMEIHDALNHAWACCYFISAPNHSKPGCFQYKQHYSHGPKAKEKSLIWYSLQVWENGSSMQLLDLNTELESSPRTLHVSLGRQNASVALNAKVVVEFNPWERGRDYQ